MFCVSPAGDTEDLESGSEQEEEQEEVSWTKSIFILLLSKLNYHSAS